MACRKCEQRRKRLIAEANRVKEFIDKKRDEVNRRLHDRRGDHPDNKQEEERIAL
jgi:hypothetical protein